MAGTMVQAARRRQEPVGFIGLLAKSVVDLDQNAFDRGQYVTPTTKNEVLCPVDIDLHVARSRNFEQLDDVRHGESEDLILENLSERSAILIERRSK